MLTLVEEQVGNPVVDGEKRGIRRIQDRDGRWMIIQYIVWPKNTTKFLKGVKLTLCHPEFEKEVEWRQRAADLLAEKVSPILREIDPMDFSDAPEDEYDSEAEYIAERILVAGEELSPLLIRGVFESMFSPGCCPENVYEKVAEKLRPVVQEQTAL